MRYSIYLITIALLLIGCKSTRTGAASPEDLATARIIKSSYKTHPDFETLSARLKVRYKDENTSQSVGVSMRMAKDETIWISASVLGISLAKAKITPERVQYYTKVDGTYFDGDFKLLSDLLGTRLDFDQVQAMLLGQPIFDLQGESYTSSAGQQYYLLAPRKQPELFNLFFYLDPQNFSLQQQRLDQQDQDRALTITYDDYTGQKEGLLPQEVRIRGKEGDKTTEIDIDYRKIELDKEVSFPFEIPSGYKQIEL